MPTYEYRCSTCSQNFDIVQPFSENTLAKCPTKKSGKGPVGCTAPGRGKVSKVFSAPGITFKGDGFYKNDSRDKSKSAAASKPPPKSDSDANGSSSGESTKTEKPTTAAADKAGAKADSKKPAEKKNEKTSS
jgi:predicted nucleic acid-binding Zn ribbon protein